MSDTRHRIISAARSTVQDHGYSGLSFHDVAEEAGITTASIHYYFPSKGDLGGAVAHQYATDFAEYLEGLLTVCRSRKACIAKYTDIFRNTLLTENRISLCGIMAAEHKALPAEVRTETVRFSEMNVHWLTRVLAPRKRQVDIAAVRRQALAVYAAIEGAQLVARSRNDIAVYDEIIQAYRTAGLIP